MFGYNAKKDQEEMLRKAVEQSMMQPMEIAQMKSMGDPSVMPSTEQQINAAMAGLPDMTMGQMQNAPNPLDPSINQQLGQSIGQIQADMNASNVLAPAFQEGMKTAQDSLSQEQMMEMAKIFAAGTSDLQVPKMGALHRGGGMIPLNVPDLSGSGASEQNKMQGLLAMMGGA